MNFRKKGVFLTFLVLFILLQLLLLVSVYREQSKRDLQDVTLLEESARLSALRTSLAQETYLAYGGSSVSSTLVGNETRYLLKGTFGRTVSEIDAFYAVASSEIANATPFTFSTGNRPASYLRFYLNERNTSLDIGRSFARFSTNVSNLSKIVFNISTRNPGVILMGEPWSDNGPVEFTIHIYNNSGAYITSFTQFIALDQDQFLNTVMIDASGTISEDAYVLDGIFSVLINGSVTNHFNVTSVEMRFANKSSPAMYFDDGVGLEGTFVETNRLYLIK